MTATMTDVARECGVSVSTVSLVINGKGRISSTTRNKVLDAVHHLGYTPEDKSSGPEPVHTSTIGLVLPHPVAVGEGYYYRAVSTMFQTTREYGYDSKIIMQDDLTSRVVDNFYKGKDQLGCDAVILFSPGHGWEALQNNLRAWHVPVALVRRGTDREGVACFLDDDYQGERLAVEHLANAGHRVIATLSRAEFQFGPTKERLRAWYDVLAERGLAVDERLNLYYSTDPARMIEQLRCAADAGLHVTAVAAIDDLVANALVDALQQHGFRVPGNVAVTGYDDDPVAVSRYPRLTTVRIPVEEMVSAACRILVRWMPENYKTQATMKFKNDLVIRESTENRKCHAAN